MPGTERGLYEVLITELLEARLRELGQGLSPSRAPLRSAEAADRIALHIGRLVQRAIQGIDDDKRVAVGIGLARKLLAQIDAVITGAGMSADAPVEPGTVLRALLARLPDGTPESIDEPLIPLLDTALLTNAPGEPRVGSQILTEIHSADRVDVVMAFIRRSGIGPLIDAIHHHCAAGRRLRVLTTTYTGSTEARALDELQQAGAEVRVSYDISTTRLHAKAWLFHRASSFSTAYIGSSNLTHSAQVSGLEWNVRVSGARNPDVIGKVSAVFESYWEGGADGADGRHRTPSRPESD
jgi:HKD family nuclease